MCDFEKNFRSCGKVTSLSLSVNAISATNSARERLFTLSDSRKGYGAFFRIQTQLDSASPQNVLICEANFSQNPKHQPEGVPLLLITDY
jgi:hypothetical protein